jgi:hypothetical protein
MRNRVFEKYIYNYKVPKAPQDTHHLSVVTFEYLCTQHKPE